MASTYEMRAKAVVCGDIVEVSVYSVPIDCGKREHTPKKRELTEYDDFDKRKDNLARSRQTVRRLIWCNQTKFTKFITLTYAQTVLDIKQVRRDFTTFVQAMRRKGYTMNYLYVLENQKSRGRKEGNDGCLHIHLLLFNDDFIPYQDLNKCWKHGQTDIKVIDNIKNLGAYVCKYITKDNLKFFGSHTFECSNGLKRPEEERFFTLGFSDSDVDFQPEEVLNALNIHYNRHNRYDFISSVDGSACTQKITYYQGTWKDKNVIKERDPLYVFKRQTYDLYFKEE